MRHQACCLVDLCLFSSFGISFRNITACVFGQKAEALESGTKQFEELEFCQLEEESGLDEKKETQSSHILQKQAEYCRSVAKRKVGIRV